MMKLPKNFKIVNGDEVLTTDNSEEAKDQIFDLVTCNESVQFVVDYSDPELLTITVL
jgi:hypothetical protein